MTIHFTREVVKLSLKVNLLKVILVFYGWRQVPVNPKVLGEKAFLTMPEIIQVLFKSNDPNLLR